MIRAAIVGLGRWGRHLVQSVQGTSDAIRFVAGVQPRRGEAAEFAQRHGFELTRYGQVLTDSSVDAVVLAHTNSLHADDAVAAARAGKHVFVEKPLALTAADAQRVLDACVAADVMLAVGFTWRFHPALIALKGLIDSGRLGTVLHVEGNYSGPSAYRHASGHWRLSRAENPAGGMAARGIHIVDAMIHTCGPMERVYARSKRRVLDAEIDDTTTALFDFESGVTATLATMMATAELWRLHVFGSKGWARMECIEHIPQALLSTCSVAGPHEVVSYVAVNTEKPELEAFAAAAGRGVYPRQPVADAVHGIAVWQALVGSADSGSPVLLR